MSTEPITLEILANHVGVITLDNQSSRNSLSLAMLQELEQRLLEAEQHPAIHVLIIRAKGPAFSAGHNLKEIQQAFGDPKQHQALFEQCSKVMQQVVSLDLPVIAEVSGVATAAGCQLVASCDLAVAAESARFATPGVNIGLFCSTPMVALSRVVSPKHALEMLLTGEMISATQAVAMGLINHAVDNSALADFTVALAEKIASKSPATLKLGKHAFYQQLNMPLAEAYRYTGQVMVDNLTQADAMEGIDAFIAKRPAQWQAKQ